MSSLARLFLVVAAVAVAVGLVGAAPAAAKLVKKTVWGLKNADGKARSDGNPLNKSAPPNGKAAASGSTIIWETRPPSYPYRFPEFYVRADITAAAPRTGEPGLKWALGVKLDGHIVSGREGVQSAGYTFTSILLVNDRWQTAPELPVIHLVCLAPGTEPRCDPRNDTADGNAGFEFPPIKSKDDRFSVGIGLLNCGPCYLRWTYSPKTIKTVPPMKDKAKFLPGRRPTIRIHSHNYDPRHIIVQRGAKLRFCNASKHIFVTPQWLPHAADGPDEVGFRRITIRPRKCKVFPFKSRQSPGKGLTHSNPRGVCTRVTSEVAGHALLIIYVLPKGAKRPTKKHQKRINRCIGTTAGKNVKILR